MRYECIGGDGLNRAALLSGLWLSLTLPALAMAKEEHKGQTFLVERRSGNSVYGFAYGDINRRGWVTDGYFC